MSASVVEARATKALTRHTATWLFWRATFAIIMAVGAWAAMLRFTRGLGAVTNLSDRFPWGLWVGFDVLCGVMLAAGGFTLTAAVHIFNIKKLHPIVRPTVLTAGSLGLAGTF